MKMVKRARRSSRRSVRAATGDVLGALADRAPEGREVVCHASAWDVDVRDDLRIRCAPSSTPRTSARSITSSATTTISAPTRISPRCSAPARTTASTKPSATRSCSRSRRISAADRARRQVPDAAQDIGLLLQQALDGVAFLPFGLLIDKWRWEVFSGELTPDEYNTAWWALRTQYQGVRPPYERPADEFDPGAKFHVPGNTPYMRYFLARIPIPVLQGRVRASGMDRAAASLLVLRLEGSRRSSQRDACARASQPWQDALEPSRASARWTLRRSSPTTRRCPRGSRSRTPARLAAGDAPQQRPVHRPRRSDSAVFFWV